MRITWVVGLGLSWLLTGCLFLDGSYHADRITAFGVRPYGSGPSYEVRADIDQRQRTITLKLPHSVEASDLEVRYESRAPLVTYNDRELVARHTRMDLRTPQLVQVHANDNTITAYTVRAIYAPLSFISLAPAQLTASGDWVCVRPNRDTQDVYFTFRGTGGSLSIDQAPPLTLRDTYFDLDIVEEHFALPVGAPHTLLLAGANGVSLRQTLRFEWLPLSIDRARLTAKQNPQFHRDQEAVIIPETRTVTFRVREGVDVSKLLAELTYEALRVRQGEAVLPNPALLNLEKPETVTLVSRDGDQQDWTVQSEFRPALSTKELTTLNFYSGTGLTAPFKPGDRTLLFGSDSDVRLDVIQWSPQESNPSAPVYSPANIYLEVATTGDRITAEGKELTQGLLKDNFFSADNWLDLTTPVALTIEAEDGSKKSFTVGIRKP